MDKLYLITGHGAGDPGSGGGGQTEAENVRRLAKRIKDLGGDRVVLLDTSRNWYADKGINTLNIPKGSWLLELHRDAANGAARGAHVIIKSGIGGADKYDRALAQALSAIFPGRANIIVERSDLANANRAAARGINYRLAEIGFIDNSTDRHIFDTRLDEIAIAILKAFDIPVTGSANQSSSQIGWAQDAKGWWYRRSDGSYPSNGWAKINGNWYAFDANGYMLSGWYNPVRGEWYWLGQPSDGAMKTGWQQINGEWYYFSPKAESGYKEGQMYADAWVGDGHGKEYYLNGDGKMAKGCWVDHARYFVDGNGLWDKSK